MNFKSLILITNIFLLSFSGCKNVPITQDLSVNLNVMTFNVRYDNPADNENNWKFRKEFAAEIIQKNDIDVLGTQEVLYTQLQDILTLLPQFTYAGVGRKDGLKAGEYSAIFYKKERFQYYDGGTFWLSENPMAVGVKGWDASLERIVTWVILKEKTTGRKIAFFNTHFDHIGVVARCESAKLLIAKVEELAKGLPFFVTGDFNSTPDSEPIKIIADISNTKHLTNTQSIASQVSGPGWTMHNFGTTPEASRSIIDYIFIKNSVSIKNHITIFEMKGNVYLTDHNPVFVKAEVL